MKVAIDLRPLQIGHQNRGIGAYLLNILNRLPTNSDISYIFVRYDNSDPISDYSIPITNAYDEVVLKKRNFSKHPVKLILYGMNGLFPNFKDLKRLKPDVYYQCDYLLGAPKIYGCKIITVSHDVIPFIFKQIYIPRWTKYINFRQFKLKSRIRLILKSWFNETKYKKGIRLLRQSKTIISVSNNTKADLVNILGIDESKIQVIYSAASFRNSSNSNKVRSEIKKFIEDIKYPMITYIGGTDLRRQIAELVYAFNLYNARIAPIYLVLCGNEFEKDSKEINPNVKQAIENSSYKKRIIKLGKISEAEKKYILTKANAFVFPSLYEGFGLPLLEAMSCDTPIITYRNSAITEIAQDYPTYVNGEGTYDIYKSLVKVLSLKYSRKDADLKILSSKFNWDKCAEQTWDIILN